VLGEDQSGAWVVSDIVQVLGSVAAVLVAFGAGWLVRELQLRYRRAKMRHRRRANVVRKRRGQPKIGVHQTPNMRREMQRVAPWGPFPTQRKPASVRAEEKQGFKLSMSADEWLEDTYEEEAPEYNEAPVDELAQWRGKVTRTPSKGSKKLSDHEIMQALLSDEDTQEK